MIRSLFTKVAIGALTGAGIYVAANRADLGDHVSTASLQPQTAAKEDRVQPIPAPISREGLLERNPVAEVDDPGTLTGPSPMQQAASQIYTMLIASGDSRILMSEVVNAHGGVGAREVKAFNEYVNMIGTAISNGSRPDDTRMACQMLREWTKIPTDIRRDERLSHIRNIFIAVQTAENNGVRLCPAPSLAKK